jgi:transcriptional regulator with XRE-family HTH domain
VILLKKELEDWFKLHKFYMGDYQTKDLATYLKVSTRTIQRWLKDKGGPNPEQLALIKRYLNTTENSQNSP